MQKKPTQFRIISKSMQARFMLLGIWLEGNAEIMPTYFFCYITHEVALATTIVKIPSQQLDPAISQKVRKLGLAVNSIMHVTFFCFFCRTVSSCYGNKIIKIPHLKLDLVIT